MEKDKYGKYAKEAIVRGKNIEPADSLDKAIENYEEYISRLVDGGYRSKETFEPIKCEFCDSTNLMDFNQGTEWIGGHLVVVFFKRKCLDCEKFVGVWDCGQWDI